MRRSKPQLWYTDMQARLRFERGARLRHPDLTASATGRGLGATVSYRVTVQVPEYESRRVRVTVRNGVSPYGVEITADGPSDSPHRYSDDALCIWDPRDPDELKWTASDGLDELLTHVAMHLFKEGYWRETREWLGPESPHAVTKAHDEGDAG